VDVLRLVLREPVLVRDCGLVDALAGKVCVEPGMSAIAREEGVVALFIISISSLSV
jgi:hypothetical protein